MFPDSKSRVKPTCCLCRVVTDKNNTSLSSTVDNAPKRCDTGLKHYTVITVVTVVLDPLYHFQYITYSLRITYTKNVFLSRNIPLQRLNIILCDAFREYFILAGQHLNELWSCPRGNPYQFLNQISSESELRVSMGIVLHL